MSERKHRPRHPERQKDRQQRGQQKGQQGGRKGGRGRRPRRRHPEARRIKAEAIDREVLDRDAQRVVSRLQRAGHEAYFVGGCVRDLMIGRVPKDFDVASSATPQEIRRLFRNGRIIGRRFRLVHVHYGDHIIETSTFRAEPADREDDGLLIVEDNEYGTAAEDALRRDFTVNALFLDPTRHEIIDFVDGLRDLERRVLRTIGDPHVRMAEDPVRIMRAVKFATRLDFEIEEPTWQAMREQALHLERSAPPRVLEEILRLLRSGTALGAFKMLRACGALEVVLPDLARYLEPEDRDPDRLERFWRLLEALDSEVHQGYEPTTAVCIAVLFVLIVVAEADPETRSLKGRPGDLAEVCWEVMEPMANSSRLSRRDFGRARRIIADQQRFTQQPSKRFSPLLFARQEEFPEALDLFGLRIEARGKGWDIFEGWQDRYERAQRATEEELEAERRRTRGRRRRRRRRKGGRGGGP